MTFPPSPWVLRGTALHTAALIDISFGDILSASGLPTVSVLPRRTVGGLYLAAYGAGSTLSYHELIAVSGVVRCGPALGIWIGRIYVDNEESLAGGREIWGLPKEVAEFEWHQSSDSVRVVARNGRQVLCAVSARLPRVRAWLPIALPTFGSRDGRLLRFVARGWSRLGLTRARWEVPPESPLAPLGLSGERFTLVHQPLRFRIPSPREVAAGTAGKR